MSPVRSTEWEFLPETPWPNTRSVRTALRNLYTGQCIVYSTQRYGINLGWSLGPPIGSIRLVAQDGSLAFNERVAIEVTGHGFVRYEVRDNGINLGWSDSEVYEWEVHGDGLTPSLGHRMRVALWNRVEGDYLVYSRRSRGINLRWSEDADARPSLARHLFLGNHPSFRETTWTIECQGLAHDADHWYITQRDCLWRVPVSVDLSDVTEPDPAHGIERVGLPRSYYNHFGQPSYGGGYLWVPLENTEDETVRPALVAYDASTLTVVGESQLNAQAKAGWCAVDAAGTYIYSSNGVIGGDDEVHGGRLRRYKLDSASIGSQELGPILLDEDGAPLTLDMMQGGVFSAPDRLYLSNGYLAGDATTWGIHLFDLRTGRRLARSSRVDREFLYSFEVLYGDEPEGITWWDLDDGRAPGIRGQLHAVLLDNDEWPNGGDDVSIKHYRVARRRSLTAPRDVVPPHDVLARP